MKKRIVALALMCLMLVGLTGCASWSRFWKSVKSDVSNGIDRTVTVYDYNGGVIGQWSGKFDVSESTDEVYFDIDGKRVIIHGGIVVNEEN
jgi:hypothetical protein